LESQLPESFDSLACHSYFFPALFPNSSLFAVRISNTNCTRKVQQTALKIEQARVLKQKIGKHTLTDGDWVYSFGALAIFIALLSIILIKIVA